MTKVLDHGHVELYNHCANDLSVVNSARISFDQRRESISDKDIGLINYLMKNRHGTPFEHNMFTFDVKAPIFVVREWQRHRIGSYNEMSGRYTELPAQWYIPKPENVRARVGKPGAYSYVPLQSMDDTGAAELFCNELDASCTISYSRYKTALDDGIAPEQARLFLHVNHYTHFFWTVNARSLMNFLNLRTDATAQWEIRQFAYAVEYCFEVLMPQTHKAWLANNRVAP